MDSFAFTVCLSPACDHSGDGHNDRVFTVVDMFMQGGLAAGIHLNALDLCSPNHYLRISSFSQANI